MKFEEFEPFINDAINRAKRYEEDLKALKTKLGTNVGLLINEMLNKEDT